jgi:L-ascorbate metabolism protein UlaG (beta-lactamase superfamily)
MLVRKADLPHPIDFMPSDHFDDKKFFTPNAPPQRGFADLIRWMLTRNQAKWTPELHAKTSLPPAIVEDEHLLATFVNHSTVLIQTEGVNILTDPIWSERASPVSFAGPKRFSPPGIDFDKLPPIHIVLLSHNHYDHMDASSLRRLQREHAPRIYAALGNERYLGSFGMKRPRILDWWQSECYSGDLIIHCTPSQHFSGRGLADRDRALWCSWVIETPGGTIYFGGDTGFGSHFQDIKNRFQQFRLAFLPIGAYDPRWFMGPVHMDPDQAIEAHQILDPAMSIGIHHETFQLTDEPQHQPRERIEKLARDRRLNFVVPRNGEAITVPEAPAKRAIV